MGDLLRVLAIIQLLIALGDGDWEVSHKTGEGAFESIDSNGKLSFTTAGIGFLMKAEFEEDGTTHHLRGETKLVGLKVRESIKLDDADVDRDDIVLSPKFAGSSANSLQSVTTEFKFTPVGSTVKQIYKFEKVLS